MTITFDGVELRNPAPFSLAPVVLCSETTLLSGKTAVQTTAETGLRVGKCVTGPADDSRSADRAGATLTITGSHHFCAIRSKTASRGPPGPGGMR